MNDKEVYKLIFIYFVVTLLLYFVWYQYTGFIFGKSDIDNYSNMYNSDLKGFALRHILLKIYNNIFPVWSFCILIPLIYWLGIVLPVNMLFGKLGVFNFIFSTSSIGLLFIVGLISQFLSISFILWFMVFIRKKFYILATISFILSLIYAPIWYFYLVILLPINYLIVFMIFCFMFLSSYMWWPYEIWNPGWSFIFYICPLLSYKYLFSKNISNESKLRTFILILPRVSRAIIFALPFFNYNFNNKQKIIIILWCLLSNSIIFYGFFVEKFCNNCRIIIGLFS